MATVIDDFMNVVEAAEAIGVTPGRIRQMISDNEIDAKKANPRAWMIHKDEVKRVAQREYTTGRPRTKQK